VTQLWYHKRGELTDIEVCHFRIDHHLEGTYTSLMSCQDVMSRMADEAGTGLRRCILYRNLYSYNIPITLQKSNEIELRSLGELKPFGPTRESHRCGRLLMISPLCIITTWLKAVSSQKHPDVHGRMADESIDQYQLDESI